jgi:fatty acid/phospholipid biosynthesis enzyme
MAKNAVSYATTFLDAYKKEIFETRWHLFFTAYLQALLSAEKYSRLLAIVKRYNLLNLEKKYMDKSVYIPVLLCYNQVALYMEGKQNKEKLVETISASAQMLLQNKYIAGRINELLDNLSDSIPAEIALIRNKLSQKQ